MVGPDTECWCCQGFYVRNHAASRTFSAVVCVCAASRCARTVADRLIEKPRLSAG